MNINRVVILLAIFGALYYGYPKYQDKKFAEQIRTELKKPISEEQFMSGSKLPEEQKKQIFASLDNNYPNINFNIRFRKINKSDLGKDTIEQMKKMAFYGACQGFYEMGNQNNEYARKMMAKIVKEDKVFINYNVKDKLGTVILDIKNPMTDCYGFAQFEQGQIPSMPADIYWQQQAQKTAQPATTPQAEPAHSF